MTTLLYEVRMLRLTIETVRNLTSAIANLLIIVGILIYIMSVVGSALWGGKVTTDSFELVSSSLPQYYYLMNYNDMLSSIVTSFSLLVVNDWPDLAQMLIKVSD